MSSILALDVGSRRIGVALANVETGFPSPLTTITNDAAVWDKIGELAREYDTETLVVGLPRNLSGQDTPQTEYTREFIKQLSEHVSIPIKTQDEALTSVKAEEELSARRTKFDKSEIDSLAAVYILEDYIKGTK